jgi:hypothetical protein
VSLHVFCKTQQVCANPDLLDHFDLYDLPFVGCHPLAAVVCIWKYVTPTTHNTTLTQSRNHAITQSHNHTITQSHNHVRKHAAHALSTNLFSGIEDSVEVECAGVGCWGYLFLFYFIFFIFLLLCQSTIIMPGGQKWGVKVVPLFWVSTTASEKC